MPEPYPRSVAHQYDALVWPVGTRIQLAPVSGCLGLDFVELMEQRQTRRHFTEFLTDVQLGSFLWLACRSRSSRPSLFGTLQESRPHPSAGGMHPTHIVIARSNEPWFRYDPIEHALLELPSTEADVRSSRAAAEGLVPLGNGVLLGLVSEPGKTAAKYENHESLVWRDAGVVIGYMSIVAEALGLSFCPLGLSGHPQLNAVVREPKRIQAAGLAVLGVH